MKITAINFNTNFPKLQFGRKNNEPQTPYGADYEVLDTLDLKRSTRIPQMKERLKSGDDISIDREKLIYSRISKAEKDAEKFVEEHPEFSYDDVLQDLICIIVECTDKDLQSDGNIYGSVYQRRRDKYFGRLINNQSNEEAMISELPVFIDQESVEDLAINSVIYKDILERTLKSVSHNKNGERNLKIMLMHDLGFPFYTIGYKCGVSSARARIITKEIQRIALAHAYRKLR